jgi:hypothetical protein
MEMRSTTRHALLAGAVLIAGMIGCSNERRVRTREVVRDQPAAAQPAPSETVIRKDSSYERTVEDR